MKIPGCHNLTIYRLHYHHHGPGRYRLPAVRGVQPGGASAGAGHHAHAADRLRLVPAVQGRSTCGVQDGQNGLGGLAGWKAQPWPYDTPLPVGLPRLNASQVDAQPLEREVRRQRALDVQKASAGISSTDAGGSDGRGRRLDVYG